MANITGTNARNVLTGTNSADVINGLAGDDDLFGRLGNDQLFGGSGVDKLYGEDDNDLLYGESGRDYLNGGLGVDTMRGGLHNDTYVVDASADSVIELANEGTDLVIASINYTLPVNVEKLTLAGAQDINGAGNALNNVITGNKGDNTLIGKDGNDVLSGRGGVDVLIGGSGDDRLLPGPGNGVADEIYGGTGNDTIDYSNAGGQVQVSLDDNSVGGAAFGDLIAGVESVIGSAFNDSLESGPGGPFHLAAGGAGNDILFSTSRTYDRVRGDAGYDWLFGDHGSADDFWLQYDLGMDRVQNFNRADGDHLFVSKTEFNLETPAGNFIQASEILQADILENYGFPGIPGRVFVFETTSHILWAWKDHNVLPVPIAVLYGLDDIAPTDIFVF